ncbi:MAG TPA: IS91 family transposase, partial [Gammaproteobacteria bacterium]|nr:IS91 family transposase [Gammaproteobacteria bacterium]
MDATLQSIFRSGFDRYREGHGVSTDQQQAANAIMSCCQTELGYEEWVCPHDGHIELQAHACR